MTTQNGVFDQISGVEKKKILAPEIDYGDTTDMVFMSGARDFNHTKVRSRTATSNQVLFQYEPSSMNTLIDRNMYVEFAVETTVLIDNNDTQTFFNIVNSDSSIIIRQFPVSSCTTALNYKINDFSHSIPLSQIVHQMSLCQTSALERKVEPLSEPDNLPYNWSFDNDFEYTDNIGVGKAYYKNVFGSSRSFYDNLSKIEVLNEIGDTVLQTYDIPKGNPFPATQPVNGGISFRFTHVFYEPVCPVDGIFTHMKTREAGLYGVKSIEFQYIINNLQRCFEGVFTVASNTDYKSHALFYNANAQGIRIRSINTVMKDECYLHVKSYNKPLSTKALSNLYIYPFSNYEVNVSNTVFSRRNVTDMNSKFEPDKLSTSGNTINWQTIPSYVYIYLKQARTLDNEVITVDPATLTTSALNYLNLNSVRPPAFEWPDIGPAITHIEISCGERSGLLSSCTQYDLYRISQRNGYQGSFIQFSGGASCVLILNPAFDLSLDEKYTSQCGDKLTFKIDNITAELSVANYPRPQVAGSIPYELCVVLHDQGQLVMRDGTFSSRTQLTNPSETLLMNVYHGGYKHLMLTGGGFLSWIKNAANTVGSFLSKAASPITNIAKSVASNLSNVPVVSDIANAVASAAPVVGQIGATIRDATGGRFLSAAQLRRRLK